MIGLVRLFPLLSLISAVWLWGGATGRLGLDTAWGQGAETARPAQQEDLAALEEEAMRAATQRVARSVVPIETFGGVEQVDGQLLPSGATTGVVVSEDGYILSSAFGFAGKPASILVTLESGKRAPATIIARDSNRMLVLLKANTDQPLVAATVAPRDQWAVGQWTVAVGRTYPGAIPNTSVGILSAINRIWGKAVQTDAKVSPSNYGGPLIDIFGRVIGILVPLSPDQQGEMAGAQWYDSGIGFAIPLVDILPHLEIMKTGRNLVPGILGVSLKGNDMYGQSATIAASPAKSPARMAGLQVGDTIVEVDGVKIQQQAQLRHALGPHMAGDKIRVTVERGDKRERIEATIELVAELEPYVRPELGILPTRVLAVPGTPAADQAGVVVRYVIPGSAAATVGLQAGDCITAVNDQQVADAPALREVIIGFDPGMEVVVHYLRGGQPTSVDIQLSPQAAAIPDDLPPAHAPLETEPGETPAVGILDIQIPEVANRCVAYVPQSYNPAIGYGLLVWLHAPGSFDQDELIERWKPLCDQQDLILLAPQSADAKRWTATELEFVRKTMDDVISRYAVDRARIVIHGYLAGGAMAYHVAFGNRELCRGVAVAAAPLPTRLGAATTDPVQPLAIYSFSSEQSEMAEPIQAGEKKLEQRAFPLQSVTVAGPERYMNSEELTRLVRWIDTLDRI